MPLDSDLTVVSDISSSSSKEQSLFRLDGSHTWHLSSTDGRYIDIPVQVNSFSFILFFHRRSPDFQLTLVHFDRLIPIF